jgi:hypothetical protein
LVILGLALFAAAVAAAVILIVQNREGSVHLHAVGQVWTVHIYWIVVAGLVIALVGVIGAAIIRAGIARNLRLRREHAELLAQNRRLAERLGESAGSSFFADSEAVDTDWSTPSIDGEYADGRQPSRRRHSA